MTLAFEGLNGGADSYFDFAVRLVPVAERMAIAEARIGTPPLVDPPGVWLGAAPHPGIYRPGVPTSGLIQISRVDEMIHMTLSSADQVALKHSARISPAPLNLVIGLFGIPRADDALRVRITRATVCADSLHFDDRFACPSVTGTRKGPPSQAFDAGQSDI